MAAAIEVVSDDPFLRLDRKCRKYAEWGVPDILVIDPAGRRGWRWDEAKEGLVSFDVYRFSSLPDAELFLQEVLRRADERLDGEDVPRDQSLYERDFHTWCLEQARLLRELRGVREAGALDAEHVAEELESLALQERRQLEDYLAALMAYRLAFEYQRTGRARERDWLAQIARQRENVKRRLEESPSLEAFLAEAVANAYRAARILAGTLAEAALEYDFPPCCPYALEQLIGKGPEPSGASG